MANNPTFASGDQGQLIGAEELKSLGSATLIQTLDAIDDPSLSPNQRLVLALTTRGYQTYNNSEKSLGTMSLLSITMFFIAAAVIYASFWLTSWILPFDWLLYTAAISMLLLALLVRLGFEETVTSLRRDANGKMDGFLLGRLDDVLDDGLAYGVALIFGATFGAHIALLHLTSTHVGVEEVGGVVDSCLLATDNLCHGVFLDVMEMYDLHVGSATGPHSFWTATLFLFFRFVYDALLIVFLVIMWRRNKVSKLFEEFPQKTTWQDIADWMHKVSNHPARLGRTLHDELVFNFLAEEYIRGNFEVVRTTSEQFANINATDDVRRLFVDPKTGQRLFAPPVASE